MNITSIKQAEKILQTFVPNVTKFTGDGLSLKRMWPMLEAVGSPHEKLKVIHLAGTSGKTSTAYFVAAILKSSGKKIGLSVSPHVDSITERLQINGKNIEDEVFCSNLEEFLQIIDKIEETPSYFELLIVFVLWLSYKLEVDYLVLETGMGGLLDATNVVSRQDKICVITDIGYDHMHILGNTLPKIAQQKAGIIHEKNIVFMYTQSPEITDEIVKRVKENEAKIFLYKQSELQEGSKLDLSNVADFQKRNWLLAEKVCNFVAKRDNLTLNPPVPTQIVVPARIETRTLNDKSILIMDGAHNQQKMQMFITSFKANYPHSKAVVMLALKSGKEYKDVLNELRDIVSKVIVTTFNTSQDLPAVSQSPHEIARYCDEIGLDVKVEANNEKALDLLLTSSSKIKIITGSFYLLSQVRKKLN